ncbi:MAG: DUF547 domain-containing protein [Pseudomonadota bacterium]
MLAATRRSVLTGFAAAPVLALGAATPAFASLAQTFAAAAAPGEGARVDNAVWTQFMQTYVIADPSGVDLVRYGDVTAGDREALKAYIAMLAGTDPASLDRDEQFAYWANLYNAVTIEVVLDAYPVSSIKRINLGGLFGGPWKKELVTVNGTPLSLDNIEHDIMRPGWGDPRVHYAVNCASIGCPNLGTRALTGATLSDDLDVRARAYVNNKRGVTVEGERIIASKIYRWFQEDFGNNEAGVLQHLRQYADDTLAERLAGRSSVDSYRYDWALNDASIQPS